MSYKIAVCEIYFSGRLSIYKNIPQLGAFSIADLIRGICTYYPDFQSKIYELSNTETIRFIIRVNDEFYVSCVEDVHILLPYEHNKVEIIAVDSLHGDAVPWLAGGLLIAAAFTGVGILGISSVSLGLAGISLVASQLFKSPKVDTSKEKTDKRSANFSGTINTTGGGQPLAIVCGEAWVGSVVASGSISPESKPV